MTPHARSFSWTLAALALLAGPNADAKQARINVTNFEFNPVNQLLNVGDHAVWVWTSGSHTVTSGTPGVPDGRFSSGSVGVGRRMSWKATNPLGVQDYYCVPHAPGMEAVLTLTAAAITTVSNFRIVEVDFGAPGDQDLIVLSNLGPDSGNLGAYRVSVAPGAPLTLAPVDIVVPLGGRVNLRLNQTGVNTQTDLYVPGVTLAGTGSVALYVPNTVNTNLAAVDQIIDYVEWGAGGQPNETTAELAALWIAGEFAPQVADGHSIIFCGSGSQYGSAFWRGSETPGAPNCSTPTVTSTWGRIKTLYR